MHPLKNAFVCVCFFALELISLVLKYDYCTFCFVIVHVLWVTNVIIVLPCKKWLKFTKGKKSIWKLFINMFQTVADTERKTIPKAVREVVWRKEYGNELDAICNICKQNLVSAFRFHVGHIIALAKGGTNTVANYRPICDVCNQSMQTTSITQFEKYFQ